MSPWSSRISACSSPLLRLNFGLPRGVELIGELEVRPGRGGLTDVAIGAKWVPVRGRWSLGTETLLLLPVPKPAALVSRASSSSRTVMTVEGCTLSLGLVELTGFEPVTS